MTKATEKKGMGTGTGLVIGIAVIYILLGLAMILIPRLDTSYIIYAAGLIMLIYGIILIVKYFLSGSYRDLGKYGFSCGVLCVLVGICMLIRAQAIAVYFPLFLGMCILLTSIIKLQTAVDLKSLENKVWFVFLIIAFVFLTAALVIVLDPMHKVALNTIYIYYILVADGAVNLISTLYLAVAIRMNHKKPEIQPSHEETKIQPFREKSEAQPSHEKPGTQSSLEKAENSEEEDQILPENTDSPAEIPEDDPTMEDSDAEKEILSIFGKAGKKREK